MAIVVIAAITSCTNTSNPLCHAGRGGLVARNAAKLGLKVKPWVKTSLAPGSGRVVTEYLEASGLREGPEQDRLQTWWATAAPRAIGNSGPLPEPVTKAIGRRRPGRGLGAVGQPQLRRPASIR